ncbi:MAG: Nif3-like dinuclear metal center hexameric protein [Acutalibacteraceae bacterium]|nr:Nif3-like dinuclear metal center hexameric protein [Acutalibacteraceae bacterium]
MTIEKIYEFLNKKFPVNTAADFDNCGFLIGDKTADVKSAVLALDCTLSAVDTAIKTGSKLIITHHPVIFSGVKNIQKGDITHTLIENSISVISMHTNLDIGENGVNDALCNALELNSITPICTDDGFIIRKGELSKACESDDFAAFIGKKLNTHIKYVGTKEIKTVAVCSGSGGEFLYDAIKNGCDALVTSEVKHHLFIEAQHLGIAVFDAGHFPTEDVIIEPLCSMLSKEFPQVKFITDHYSPIKVF